MILFDLRKELKKSTEYLIPLNASTLTLAEEDAVQFIKVSNRHANQDGASLLISPLTATYHLKPGDRLTITGGIAENHPEDNWAIEIRRGTIDWKQLSQQITPVGFYSMTYLLEDTDLQSTIWIQTNHWGSTEPTMDFFIDSILITRF